MIERADEVFLQRTRPSCVSWALMDDEESELLVE